jgi:sugar/nucleoside kinase (ribokinase family)
MFEFKKIGVVGSTTIDKIVTSDRVYLKLGGVTTYAGITYGRNSVPAVIVSNLAGRDFKIIKKLKAEKLNVFKGLTDQTTHFINHTQGPRRYQELTQKARPIAIGQIQAIIDKVNALHLGPLHPHDIDAAAFSWMHQLELPIFLDVQGFTRRVENHKVYPSVSHHLSDALKSAQVIKANEDEYQSILEFYQHNIVELMIRFKIEESVVTSGGKGGFVATQDGKIFKYAPESVESQADSTGAGDVFFAAYIISRYLKKKKMSEACRYAAQIAARQVEGKFISASQLGLE